VGFYTMNETLATGKKTSDESLVGQPLFGEPKAWASAISMGGGCCGMPVIELSGTRFVAQEGELRDSPTTVLLGYRSADVAGQQRGAARRTGGTPAKRPETGVAAEP